MSYRIFKCAISHTNTTPMYTMKINLCALAAHLMKLIPWTDAYTSFDCRGTSRQTNEHLVTHLALTPFRFLSASIPRLSRMHVEIHQSKGTGYAEVQQDLLHTLLLGHSFLCFGSVYVSRQLSLRLWGLGPRF